MNELPYDVWELIVNKNCETIDQKLDKVDDFMELYNLQEHLNKKMNKIMNKFENKYEVGNIIQIEGYNFKSKHPIYSVISKFHKPKNGFDCYLRSNLSLSSVGYRTIWGYFDLFKVKTENHSKTIEDLNHFNFNKSSISCNYNKKRDDRFNKNFKLYNSIFAITKKDKEFIKWLDKTIHSGDIIVYNKLNPADYKKILNVDYNVIDKHIEQDRDWDYYDIGIIDDEPFLPSGTIGEKTHINIIRVFGKTIKRMGLPKHNVIDIIGSKYINKINDDVVEGYKYDGDYQIKFDRWDRYIKATKTKKTKILNIDGLDWDKIDIDFKDKLEQMFLNWSNQRNHDYSYKYLKVLNGGDFNMNFD